MRILLAEDEVLTRMDLRGMLEDAGMEVVGEAKDGIEAVQRAEELNPDLVLLDIKMPMLDGLTASRIILKKGYSQCIVMLTAYTDAEYIKNAMTQTGVYGYLLKPISPRTLIPTIKVAYQKSQENEQLKSELQKSKKKLADRIVIERAKGYLMKRDHISEEEAYCRLRKMSQDRHCSMRFISEALIVELESNEETEE